MTKRILLATFILWSAHAYCEDADTELSTGKRNTLPASRYDNPTADEIQMHHPNAEKGLMRITSNKDYIYEVTPSPKSHGLGVKLGMFDPKNLANPERPEITFSDIYSDSNSPMFLFDYEWVGFSKFGRFNVVLGSGLYFTQGKGRFKNSPTVSAREQFTFIAVPMTFNLNYKLQFWDKQWIVPYAGGGVGGIGFAELRDDNKGPKAGGSLISQAYGGGALSLNAMSSRMGIEMDREYGINHTWITLEMRKYFNMGSDYDFSGDLFAAGLLIEY